MTQKERVESALHTAVTESQHTVKEIAAAAKRGDDEAVAYWQAAAEYWIDRIEHYAKQLKEVDA